MIHQLSQPEWKRLIVFYRKRNVSNDPLKDIWVLSRIFLNRKEAILDAVQTVRAFTENRGLQRAIATFEAVADDLKKAGL